MTRRSGLVAAVLVVLLALGVNTYLGFSDLGKIEAATHSRVTASIRASQIEACYRNAENTVNDLNAWYDVDRADYQIADAKLSGVNGPNANVRLVEAQGIDREMRSRARRIDYHYAAGLHAAAWRHATEHAGFSCVKAYTSP